MKQKTLILGVLAAGAAYLLWSNMQAAQAAAAAPAPTPQGNGQRRMGHGGGAQAMIGYNGGQGSYQDQDGGGYNGGYGPQGNGSVYAG